MSAQLGRPHGSRVQGQALKTDRLALRISIAAGMCRRQCYRFGSMLPMVRQDLRCLKDGDRVTRVMLVGGFKIENKST